MTRLDVLVVTYKSRETIGDLIRSLALLNNSFIVRLAIHDNSMDEELVKDAHLLSRSVGIEMTGSICQENCGFSRACNSLATASDADWLLFLNPDARISIWPEQWHPDRGIWGAQIVNQSGIPETSFGRTRTVRSEMLTLYGRRVQPPPDGRGYVSGAALLIDRASFEALGGFDERFFMYYEDIDLGLRAGKAGVAVNLCSNWVVAHTGGHSARESHRAAMIRSYRSAREFHRKYRHPWRSYSVGFGLYAGIKSGVSILYPPWRADAAGLAKVARTALADAASGRRSDT